MEVLNNKEEEIKIKENPQINEGYIFPSLLKRIQAIFIDSLIIILLFWGVSYLFTNLESLSPVLRILFFMFIVFLYEPLFIYFFKGTIGQQILNLKVTKFSDSEKRLGLLNAIFRFSIKWFFGWISFLSIFFNNKNRAFHDILSNSIVSFAELSDE